MSIFRGSGTPRPISLDRAGSRQGGTLGSADDSPVKRVNESSRKRQEAGNIPAWPMAESPGTASCDAGRGPGQAAAEEEISR